MMSVERLRKNADERCSDDENLSPGVGSVAEVEGSQKESLALAEMACLCLQRMRLEGRRFGSASPVVARQMCKSRVSACGG